MKKILIPALALFAFACKSTITPQQKAETLVKNYLDSALNDPKSYEPIAFKPVDSTFTSFKYSDEALVFNKKVDSLNNIIFDLITKSKDDSKQSKEVAALNDAKSDAATKYKGKFKGFSIVHEYRAKNGFNAIIKSTNTFLIDSAMTKVWDMTK